MENKNSSKFWEVVKRIFALIGVAVAFAMALFAVATAFKMVFEKDDEEEASAKHISASAASSWWGSDNVENFDFSYVVPNAPQSGYKKPYIFFDYCRDRGAGSNSWKRYSGASANISDSVSTCTFFVVSFNSADIFTPYLSGYPDYVFSVESNSEFGYFAINLSPLSLMSSNNGMGLFAYEVNKSELPVGMSWKDFKTWGIRSPRSYVSPYNVTIAPFIFFVCPTDLETFLSTYINDYFSDDDIFKLGMKKGFEDDRGVFTNSKVNLISWYDDNHIINDFYYSDEDNYDSTFDFNYNFISADLADNSYFQNAESLSMVRYSVEKDSDDLPFAVDYVKNGYPFYELGQEFLINFNSNLPLNFSDGDIGIYFRGDLYDRFCNKIVSDTQLFYPFNSVGENVFSFSAPSWYSNAVYMLLKRVDIDFVSTYNDPLTDLPDEKVLNFVLTFPSSTNYFYKNLGYENGYENGYSLGESAGRSAGYSNGYIDGYNYGFDLGNSGAGVSTFDNFFGAVLDAPITLIFGREVGQGLLNFEVLGVNMSSFFLSILTLGIVLAVVRLVVKFI